MDYSKWTDFAINAAVGAATGEARNSEPLLKLVIRNSTGRKFDPCNNPADAWPIIQKSGISLVYDGDDWVALHFSRTSLTYPNDHRKHPDKPFRAALILWLMMQESE